MLTRDGTAKTPSDQTRRWFLVAPSENLALNTLEAADSPSLRAAIRTIRNSDRN